MCFKIKDGHGFQTVAINSCQISYSHDRDAGIMAGNEIIF